MFWFVAGMFLLATLGFLLPPLLRTKEKPLDSSQKELTINIYRDQFAELENDLKNNVIQQDQYEKARQDIERNLLDDVAQLEKKEKAALSGKAGKLTAVIVSLAVPILTVILYGQWGAGEAGLDPEAAAPVVQNEQHNQQNIEMMVGQLEERLALNPQDGEGWFMLARTLVFLRRFEEAVAAFEKLLPLGGDKDPDLLAAYADTIAMAGGRTLTPKARQAIQQALMLDPFHVQALWLAGTATYQDENYQESLKYWERIRQIVPPGSQDAQQILNNINEIRGILGQPPLEPEPITASSVQIRGSVRLAESLAGQASPDDTIFVFARAAEGPRMPLAIVQKQVKDLPFEFTLDDSQAMNPMMRLSSVSQVIVGARISKTSEAMPRSGDLEGFIGPVPVGDDAPVHIAIDKIVQ